MFTLLFTLSWRGVTLRQLKKCFLFTDQSNQSISLSRTLIGPVIFQLSSVKQISCTHPFPKSNSGLRNNVIFLRKFKVQKIYLNSVKTWSQFRLGFEIYWQNSSFFNTELGSIQFSAEMVAKISRWLQIQVRICRQAIIWQILIGALYDLY